MECIIRMDFKKQLFIIVLKSLTSFNPLMCFIDIKVKIFQIYSKKNLKGQKFEFAFLVLFNVAS